MYMSSYADKRYLLSYGICSGYGLAAAAEQEGARKSTKDWVAPNAQLPRQGSHAFEGGLTRDGQLAIAPTTTPGLTSVITTKATLIHQAMCQSAAVTPITVSKTLTDKIE
jgi:hypothetical protein